MPAVPQPMQQPPTYAAPQTMAQVPPPSAPPVQDQQHPLNQPMQATLSSIDATDSTQMHAYVADEVAGVKQSLKLIQLVYIVGGLIFFAVYALFWVRFFNIALPF
jgi:hypothetical protein